MDRYYSSIKNDYSKDELIEAGYISETMSYKDTSVYPITPLPSINNFSLKKDNVILLSTGAFAPVHEGHVEKLKAAKQFLENKGKHVVAGYLSPSHDQYVLSKIGDQQYNIFQRLKWLHEKVAETKWLYVSPWEACWTKEPVNFTTVIDYLKYYINHFLKNAPKFEVVYVYGSDNHAFGRAFKHHGQGICVKRGGVECQEYTNVLNLESSHRQSLNSTALRQNPPQTHEKTKDGVYLLRNDVGRALPNALQKKISFDEECHFIQEVKNALQNYNSVCDCIYTLNEKEECDVLNNYDLSNYVSLDVYHGVNQKRISRLFKMGGGQNSPQSLVCSQSKDAVWDKEIAVFDDDSVSGGTLSFIEKQFKTSIKDVLLLSDLIQKHSGLKEIVDVADGRDFLFGAKEGGLLVEFGQNDKDNTPYQFKCPYIFPFVNPVTRLNIKPELIVDYSMEILCLNEMLYNNKNIKIEDFENSDIMKLASVLNINQNKDVLLLIEQIKMIVSYVKKE